MEQGFDIVVVGGGLVGASLACALEGCGLAVAQVEAAPARVASAGEDDRNLALARASVNALQALGVWQHLPAPAAPIRHVHVSSRGDFGAVRLAAQRYRLDAFGAVVPASALATALETRIGQLRDTTVLRPARVERVECGEEAATLHLATPGGNRTLRTRLLVAADGARSQLRGQLGIGAREHDYGQTLFVAGVRLPRPHGDTAYERFTEDGPVALLPLPGQRAGTVLTVAASDASAVAALDEDGYRELLHQRFGWKLGRFGRIGRRHAHPMALLQAERLVATRAVLVGNAAQTLHPVGAQGFNLGLRDALTLAEEVRRQRGGDPGTPELLARHAARRAEDRARTIAFSDGLAHAFRSGAPPVRLLRSLGLLALDRIPGLASGLVAGAMGFRGDVPRLATGTGA